MSARARSAAGHAPVGDTQPASGPLRRQTASGPRDGTGGGDSLMVVPLQQSGGRCRLRGVATEYCSGLGERASDGVRCEVSTAMRN